MCAAHISSLPPAHNKSETDEPVQTSAHDVTLDSWLYYTYLFQGAYAVMAIIWAICIGVSHENSSFYFFIPSSIILLASSILLSMGRTNNLIYLYAGFYLQIIYLVIDFFIYPGILIYTSDNKLLDEYAVFQIVARVVFHIFGWVLTTLIIWITYQYIEQRIVEAKEDINEQERIP